MQGAEAAYDGAWLGDLQKATEDLHYRIKGKYSDDDATNQGFVVADDTQQHYPLCRSPARTPGGYLQSLMLTIAYSLLHGPVCIS